MVQKSRLRGIWKCVRVDQWTWSLTVHVLNHFRYWPKGPTGKKESLLTTGVMWSWCAFPFLFSMCSLRCHILLPECMWGSVELQVDLKTKNFFYFNSWDVLHMHVYLYLNVCVHVIVYLYVRICLYVSMCVYCNIYKNMWTYIFMYMCEYMCMFMYMLTFMCICV